MKAKCRECDWRGLDSEILRAANPFDPEDKIQGCPKCQSVNSLEKACDFDGCWFSVCCGTLTKDGYKWTCHEHTPERREA